MIGKLLGLGTAARHVGEAVGGVAEVFVGNRAQREAGEHERAMRALAQYAEEFSHPGIGWFDQLVNGLNRLPRPMMAVGTLGLFGYAMVEPEGFAMRMQGLAYVPEPLWWLLGAIVSFYFGARELHHYRCRKSGMLLTLPRTPVPELPALPRPDTVPPAALPVTSDPEALPVDTPTSAPEARPAAHPAGQPSSSQAAPRAAGPAAAALPAVDPTDPHFNAAVAEWAGVRAA